MSKKSENNVLIEARNLTKWYGDVCAVDNVSFEVKRGEVVGFLGPNGAGKTTTMKMIISFIAPTAGYAKVAGHDTLSESMEVRRSIGYLPEDTPLYKEMSVMEFLEFIAGIREIPKDQVQKRMEETIKVCGLTKVIGRPIGHLSKGFRQRVGLAQAMLHDPDILILDEPWTGLDPNQIADVRRLIKELGKNKTVLVSTHILAEVEAVCDRVIIIDRGRIVANDLPESIIAKEGEIRFVLRVRNGENTGRLQTEMKKIQGVKDVEVESAGKETTFRISGMMGKAPSEEDILKTLRNQAAELLSIRHQTSTLEDVFRKMTVGDRVEIGVKAS